MTILALNLHCIQFEMKCTLYLAIISHLQCSSSMYLFRENGINEQEGQNVKNLISEHALLFMYCRAVVSGGAEGALATPEFGKSINPIPTRGGRLCLPHYS